MHQLLDAIPDLEVFLTLEPEEIGAKILFLLRKPEYAGQVSPDLLIERIVIAEATEVILLANHLLRIVESRAQPTP